MLVSGYKHNYLQDLLMVEANNKDAGEGVMEVLIINQSGILQKKVKR